MTMIFQDPVAALNPVFTIEDQLTTVIRRGEPGAQAARAVRAIARARARRGGDRGPRARARLLSRSSSAAGSTSAS